MQIASDTKVVISKQVMSQEVRGETVLLDLSGEIYFGLDAIGTHVWRLLREGRTLEQLLNEMSAEFDVGRDQLEIDVTEFLEKLMSAGLINAEPL